MHDITLRFLFASFTGKAIAGEHMAQKLPARDVLQVVGYPAAEPPLALRQNRHLAQHQHNLNLLMLGAARGGPAYRGPSLPVFGAHRVPTCGILIRQLWELNRQLGHTSNW